MAAVFVTATGTDAGKTYVSAGLIAACRRVGRRVDALKPVVSGFDPAYPEQSDTGVLLGALGEPVTPETVARVSPWRFEAPLSPDMAAALEGRALPLEAVVAACHAALRPDHMTIIEGVGGVMVPLEPGRTILDLMAALALPVVLVSPTGLGAISHLLTALDVLARRGLAPVAIILSEIEGSTVPLDATLATLAGFCRPDDLFLLRRMAPSLQEPVFDAILARLPGAGA
jgi:dethiobiotin synthetase